MSTHLERLECGRCREPHDAQARQGVCVRCGGPLLARYRALHPAPTLEEILARPPGQHRLVERAPFAQSPAPTLGEGATPLLHAPRLADALDLPGLRIKDEGQNPTCSFKARGMVAAMIRARELGIEAVCLPSAGNAGGAAAAYGAHLGIEVHVYMPESTPAPVVAEARSFGAEVVLTPGTIADAGAALAAVAGERGWFSLATLREPYRIEGKKVMGFELLYDLGRLPDAVIYPTGGGTGLIGMWKAFEELEALGLVGPERPRMISVQSEACAPIVRAFEAGEEAATPWAAPGPTAAFGLRVPGALGDFLILRAVRESGGTALAVSEEALLSGERELAALGGVHGSAEGGACVAAARTLRERGELGPEDLTVVFNTGHALKYLSP